MTRLDEHISVPPNKTYPRNLSQDSGHQVVNVSNTDMRSDEILRHVMSLEGLTASLV